MSRDRLLFFVLLALAARLTFLVLFAHPEILHGALEPRNDTDEGDYHQLASQVAQYGRYSLTPDGPSTAIRPPGTVLPLAMLYSVFGPSPALGVGYVLLCSLALVVVVGVLAKEVDTSPFVRDAAMLITALMPTAVYTAAGILFVVFVAHSGSPLGLEASGRIARAHRPGGIESRLGVSQSPFRRTSDCSAQRAPAARGVAAAQVSASRRICCHRGCTDSSLGLLEPLRARRLLYRQHPVDGDASPSQQCRHGWSCAACH